MTRLSIKREWDKITKINKGDISKKVKTWMIKEQLVNAE